MKSLLRRADSLGARWCIVLGDSELERNVVQLKDLAAHVHAVPIPDHSCFSPDDLCEIAAELGFATTPHEDVDDALMAIPAEARVLIFGSLYLAGSVLAANDQVPD